MPLFFRKDISKMTDNELLLRYREDGNSQWVGQLYERYNHLVFGTCLKYLKDRDEAKDATLAIFEKLMLDLRTREVATFQHWLYTVTKNHCLQIYRKTSKEQHELKDYIGLEKETSLEEEWIAMQLREEGLRALERAIENLNSPQRTCVQMFYLERKSYKQISGSTGYSEGEIKSYLQNGRRNLKLMMQVNS
jgi:RNA polymerase sigma factor (sigma-70 family)